MFSSEPRLFVALAGEAGGAEFVELPLACGAARSQPSARVSSADVLAAPSAAQRFAEAFEQGRAQGAAEARAAFAADAGATLARIEQALASARDADNEALAALGRGSLDVAAAAPEDGDIVQLGDALKALANVDPRLAQVIECRFFAGYNEVETAEILGVTDRTVRRWWTQARAWIYREMAVA